MNQNLNLCAHALAFFKNKIENNDYGRDCPLTEKNLKFVVELLNKSEKFIISDGISEIITGDNDYTRPLSSFSRPPFPVLAIESESNKLRFIYIIVEVRANTSESFMFPELINIGEGVLVWPIIGFHREAMGGWAISSGAQYLSYPSAIEEPFFDIWSVEFFDDKDAPELNRTDKTWVPSRVFHNMCKLLNCKNIETRTEAPSAKLNKKRERNGKIPFFEYKTLHIKPGKTNASGSGAIISDRNSPRVHIRRGHIRTLPSGETTWVQACVVGDGSKGFIQKDYRI